MFAIFFGIFLAVVGVLMTVFSRRFLENLGRIDWAERKFPGGSSFFYKFLGLVFFFVGMLLIFGLFEGIVASIFGAPRL